ISRWPVAGAGANPGGRTRPRFRGTTQFESVGADRVDRVYGGRIVGGGTNGVSMARRYSAGGNFQWPTGQTGAGSAGRVGNKLWRATAAWIGFSRRIECAIARS